MSVQDTTMLSELTVADLKDLFRELQLGEATEVVAPTGRQVFGLKGIQELFGVSHKTAQRLKDHDIKQAVFQNGRMIVVDVDKALMLFNRKGGKRHG